MKARIEKFLRTFAIPLGATALAILFWSQYQCQGYWWWLVIIGAILAFHYLYFWKWTKTSAPKV